MHRHLNANEFSAFREGDHAAFKLVFDTYYQPLCYFTIKLIANRQDAEEIVLNSFQKLFERCAHMETAASIRSFLYITARNNSFDYLRSVKVLKINQQQFAEKMQDETFLQLEYEIKDELVELVRKAVNNLPAECSKIFRMLYYDELTPNEVAEILEISVSTVYNQKSRALQSLRIAMAGHPMAIALLLVMAAWIERPFVRLTSLPD
jgi:RNA polymerase sigma-70 factor (ECF subfamily)